MLRLAEEDTRRIYKLGRESDNDGDNWILRWLLWHVFRSQGYPGNRGQDTIHWQSRPHRVSEDVTLHPSMQSTDLPRHRSGIYGFQEGSAVASSKAATGTSTRTSTFYESSPARVTYWDPVRNIW